jgi:hypothetical protein
MFYPICIA